MWIKRLLLILAAAHFIAALSVMLNHVSSPATVTLSDSFQMQYYLQFSQGAHRYYPRGELRYVNDGYTPLASNIYGWTIRLFGPDIRGVRAVAALFGLGAFALVGLCTYRLTNDRYYACIAAFLSASVDSKWYLDVGPNTLHVTFSLLGFYLLLRHPKPDTKTAVWAALALFASFWTKQTGLAYMLAGALYLFIVAPRQGAIATGVMVILSFIGIVYYVRLPDSQFIYWVFEFNKHQPLIYARIWDVVFVQILTRKYVILVALILLGLLTTVRHWRDLLKVEYIFIGAAAVAGTYANCKYGSGPSQLWFFYTLMVVLGVSFAARLAQSKVIPSYVAGILLSMQSLSLVEDIRPLYINADDESRYEQIMATLSGPGRSSYYINRGYLSYLTGQRAYPMVSEDVWHNRVFSPEIFSPERLAYIQSNPWDIVIIDEPLEDGSFNLYQQIQKGFYRPIGEIPRAAKYANGYDIRWRKIIFQRSDPPPAP